MLKSVVKILNRKRILILGLIIFLALFWLCSQVNAQLDVGLEPVSEEIQLGTADLRVTIARIIRASLGFLGVLAVALVLYGGFLYMTAQGIPEKIDKAKKTLVAAVIGLVIILSAFAIASFVLNQLLQAIGPGAPGDGDGGPDGGDIPGGVEEFCPNPSLDQNPWLCIKAKDQTAKSGRLITLYGGNVGETSGKIYFTDQNKQNQYEAEIVTCKDDDVKWFKDISNSDLKQVKVRVPKELKLAENIYWIVADTENGLTINKDWQFYADEDRLDRFTYQAGDDNSPNIICFTTEIESAGDFIEGAEIDYARKDDRVRIKGEKFGATGTVNYNSGDSNDLAVVNDWQETYVSTIVPATASGEVRVTRNDNAYDEDYLVILCNTGSDCGTNCCQRKRGRNVCVAEDNCLSDEGEACFDGIICTEAEFGCQSGLYCDPADCTCKRRGAGAPCDATPETPSCEADDTLCGDEFYCSAIESCTCQYLPRIDGFDPQAGGPGNFVSIYGRGFGTEINTNSKIIFLGADTDGDQNPEGDADDLEAILPMNCGAENIWQDNQIIIEIPEGAVTGPFKLINSDGLEETTMDSDGIVADFIVDANINYPSLCSMIPDQGEFRDSIELAGKNFGAEATGQVLIGGLAFLKGDNWTWAYDPADQLDKVIDALVPNIEPAENLPVQIKSGDTYSNKLNFTVIESGKAPRIDYIDPNRGPIGQYITIYGSNFGQAEGLVKFKHSNGDFVEADLSFPGQCLGNFWHDTYITVKVPSLGPGNPLASEIFVETKNSGNTNIVNFEKCIVDEETCPLRPGICLIEPSQGPVGTEINIYGDNFNSYDVSNSKVVFWDNQSLTPPTASWASQQIGPINVPTQTTTGPVKVIDRLGNTSNQMPFTVADCRDDNTICDTANTGNICCETDGVCKTEVECYGEKPPMCFYAWSFATGQIPEQYRPPQVVEDIECTENTQSPSPWRDSDSNCLNAMISVRFNRLMNAATFNTNNIIVKECWAENYFDEEFGSECVVPDWHYSTRNIYPINEENGFYGGFIYEPPVNGLQPGRWYEVTLKSSNGYYLKSREGVWLDGDFDYKPGGDYSWYFRIRDSFEECSLEKVVVTPQKATMETITDRQEYSALATAANCNILNGDSYDWDWYKLYTDGTKEDGPVPDPQSCDRRYCIAEISEIDENNDGNTDWRQIASPLKQGFTFVGAQAVNKKDDNNELVIDLNIPEIYRIYPDNGLLHPDVNAYVTIYGTNFGNTQRDGKVFFDNVEAKIAPDCPEAWSDSQIQVIVPNPTPIKPTDEPTYSLAGIREQDGMVIFYDMDDSSNVILEDKAGNNNGEIFGAERVPSTFGKALSFNGQSDYVKLPNIYNLASGSLELWFKPNFIPGQRQTLFSISDGTADNILALEIDPVDQDNAKFTLTLNTSTGQSNNITVFNVLENDRWHHLVFTYDGAKYYFYINGRKFYYFPGGNISASNQTDLWFNADIEPSNVLIGAKNTGEFIDYYNGLIEGFALYNKVLTEDEVRTRYGLQFGQILLLDFEGIGSELIDSSANNFKNLTFTNPEFRIDEGRYGKGFANSVIEVIDNPSLNFKDQIAIEGWFKAPDFNQSFTIFNSASQGIKLGNLTDCGAGLEFCFKLFLVDETNIANRGYRWASLDSNKIRNNAWNYFAGVYDGQTIKLYLNDEVPAEWQFAGRLYESTDFGYATIAGTYGQFDNIAVYNRALTEAEINSRVGAKNGSNVIVQTSFGYDDSLSDTNQLFYHSDIVYPFLCRLKPNVGLEGTQVAISGDNFGDSNKTIYQGLEYDLGSLVYFGLASLLDEDIRDWSNRITNAINPFSDIGNPEIPVSISIDPFAEPFIDEDGFGIYTPGEQYADILEPFSEYNQGFYEVEKFNPEDIRQTGIIETESELQSNTLFFYFSPVITRITPNNGPNGQWVTIHGYNFGHNPGEVYFFNDQVAEFPPEPCENFWTNTQIIVVVPELALSGEVYLVTEQGLISNRVNFEVNDKPLGAGICQIEPDMGVAGSGVIVKGDRFDEEGDGQGEDQLLFNENKPAAVADWQNRVLTATVPTGAIDGNVVVTKRREVSRECTGFSIGSWCPSGQYDIIYEDVPSNPVRFNVLLGCDVAGTGQICTDASEEPGFPIRPYYSQGDPRNFKVDTGILATDGTYLYTKNWGIDNYGGNIPGVEGKNIIYKIGTGYNGTDLGKIYKEYVWRDRDGNDPLSAISITYHSDNNLYLGHNILQDSQYFIPKIIFDDTNNEFYLENVSLPDYLLAFRNANITSEHKSALISSNGRFIFNVALYGSPPEPNGYRVKIFDPQNNWRKIKEFEVSNSEQIKAMALTDGLVVAGEILYMIGWRDEIVAINWQEEDWVESWQTHNNDTFEINGQYDWLNNVFWISELTTDMNPFNPLDPNNQIHRYPACPLEGEGFCRADTDCEKCGPGTSSCINGRCTPYITSFIPDQGPVGTWVDLYGCYFGCDQGTILFTDNKPALLINDPECNASWQCDETAVDCPGIGPGCDRVQVEVPDETTPFDTTDDAVTGPITLITAMGLRTETDFDFVVTDEALGHQMCSLIPDYGNRGITVRIHGENFEDDGGDINNGDYVYFGLGDGLTAREPWLDSNTDGSFTAGEAFIDFNNNGQYDVSLNDDEYSFNIANYVSSAAKCPADGWDDNDICITVPRNIENLLGATSSAGGQGNEALQAISNVKVFKANDDNNDREGFALTFGNCGNQLIETNKGEQCDGISLPNLSCCQLGYIADKVCQDTSNPCLDDIDCPGSSCIAACQINCNNQCKIEVCNALTGLCSSLDQLLCGNSNLDSICEEEEGQECLEPPVCKKDGLGNDIIIYSEECDDGNKSSGDGCDNMCRLEAPVVIEVPGPQVEATVPSHGEEAFCRNGIIDVYFDSLINSATITKDNIKIQVCTSLVMKEKKSLLARFWYNFKDTIKKLIGVERQALAQLTCASYNDFADFDFKIRNRNSRTILSVIPTSLLERDKIYRVKLTPGVENLLGGSLDNLAGEPDGTPIDDGSGDYIFDFKTLGVAGDELSGICNVEWINVNVYRHEYAGADPPLEDRESELRNNDLFICAGRDDCNLSVDYDQDSVTGGNQHIYEAIAKYSGGFTLKAEYQWSRTNALDPQNAISLYNNLEDLDTDPSKVKNNSGITYVTAEPIKEATAKLGIEAQAEGSWTAPAQQDFLVYILLCENPWPSINEKFPISSLINAYNFQLYYCRDAGRPGDTSDDLPAARWLFPEVAALNVLGNTDFELGSLSNWVPPDGSEGDAFRVQPVFSDITLLRQGDGVSSNIQGSWWIGTKENYHGDYWEDINSTGQGSDPTGVLHSQAFLIEGDQIRFLIGGSQTDSATLDSFTEIESPPAGLVAVVLAVKDDPLAGEYYEIVRKATGQGTTTMREEIFDTSQFMTGRVCQSDADCNNYGTCDCDGECSPQNSGQCSAVAGIIYIYDNDSGGYINFDYLRQFKQGVAIPIRF